MKPSNILKALKTLALAKRPGFIWGPPGVGKSDIMRQLAVELGYELVDVRAPLLDPVDLRGLPVIVDGSVKWVPPVFIPKEPKLDAKGKPERKGVIFFADELNAAPPMVQASFYQLVLDRAIGETRLPDDCVVFAAGNRETDRAVTSRMPSALANRFVHLNFEVDLNDWIGWALEHNLMVEVISFLRYRSALLHDFDPTKAGKAFPTPRSWDFVSQVLSQPHEADTEYELIQGIVGEGAAAEFMGFLKVARDLPDPDSILNAPEKAPVLDDPATLYALCGALADRASKTTMPNLVKYANRLSPEFSVLLIRASIKKDKSVTATKAFVDWASKHSEILTG